MMHQLQPHSQSFSKQLTAACCSCLGQPVQHTYCGKCIVVLIVTCKSQLGLALQIEPGEERLLATACSDNSVCVWDVRKLSQGAKPLSTVSHSLTCQSAYFAPDGTATLPPLHC